MKRAGYILAILFASIVCIRPSKAQTQFTRIFGPFDRDVVTPEPVLKAGEVDAPALEEIVEHLKAVGPGVWKDMTGTGRITYSGSTQSFPATLTILGGDRYWLDSGAGSLLVNGVYSAFEDSTGKKTFPGPEFARGGLNAFAKLRTDDFPNANTTILEKGIRSVDGTNLHRISIVQVIPLNSTYGISSVHKTPANFLVTDLYFDPASHLLIKSAATIRIAGAGNQEFLECVTYGDYRAVDGIQVPFSYSETLNGQVERVLQLDTVTLNSGVQSSSFTF